MSAHSPLEDICDNSPCMGRRVQVAILQSQLKIEQEAFAEFRQSTQELESSLKKQQAVSDRALSATKAELNAVRADFEATKALHAEMTEVREFFQAEAARFRQTMEEQVIQFRSMVAAEIGHLQTKFETQEKTLAYLSTTVTKNLEKFHQELQSTPDSRPRSTLGGPTVLPALPRRSMSHGSLATTCPTMLMLRSYGAASMSRSSSAAKISDQIAQDKDLTENYPLKASAGEPASRGSSSSSTHERAIERPGDARNTLAVAAEPETSALPTEHAPSTPLTPVAPASPGPFKKNLKRILTIGGKNRSVGRSLTKLRKAVMTSVHSLTV
ncbi:uncharacterized protein EV422DRAFT_315746 [Fimicolochytrium jonesii]|uniref:uncharacterized protein n=1 Tax=Fimicolochytrium jonesii TaxID=1396493 RepID=UPI0022FEF5AC|nr:uncharacterized protein EV422DRAFT_315746 [Fimicolochytrium jonesii]KAI8824304.1 hypothetical protein EV422DRAFT_315746 [Fimicolochytrium jonesii]